MIEVLDEIATRLRENMTSFKTIGNPAVYMYSLENNTPITPLLPAIWITPGGATPITNEQRDGNYNARAVFPFQEEQDYELWLMLPHELDDLNHTLTDVNAAPALYQVIKLLHSWQPDHKGYARKMIYKGRDTPDYNGDYAVYPLTFSILRSVTDAETA